MHPAVVVQVGQRHHPLTAAFDPLAVLQLLILRDVVVLFVRSSSQALSRAAPGSAADEAEAARKTPESRS